MKRRSFLELLAVLPLSSAERSTIASTAIVSAKPLAADEAYSFSCLLKSSASAIARTRILKPSLVRGVPSKGWPPHSSE